MSVEDIAQELKSRVLHVCNEQARYRVLWIVGEPRSGKTTVVRHLSSVQGWRYINFTLDEGFLDSIIGSEEIYLPENFLTDFSKWCADTKEKIVVIDEIEPLLTLWTWNQQELFIRALGKSTRLPVGVVFVTRMRTIEQLHKTLFDLPKYHLYKLPQGAFL